jgi:hypothetical protein
MSNIWATKDVLIASPTTGVIWVQGVNDVRTDSAVQEILRRYGGRRFSTFTLTGPISSQFTFLKSVSERFNHAFSSYTVLSRTTIRCMSFWKLSELFDGFLTNIERETLCMIWKRSSKTDWQRSLPLFELFLNGDSIISFHFWIMYANINYKIHYEIGKKNPFNGHRINVQPPGWTAYTIRWNKSLKSGDRNGHHLLLPSFHVSFNKFLKFEDRALSRWIIDLFTGLMPPVVKVLQ